MQVYVHKTTGNVTEYPVPVNLDDHYTVEVTSLNDILGKAYDPITESWSDCPKYLDAQVDAQRRREYGSIAEQLDEIYHNGLDAWKTRIAEVKFSNPKGGG